MSAQTSHEAILGEGVAYFIYSFDASRPFDINAAANRLLKAGIAETAVSPRNGEVRVAHRYRRLVRLMEDSTTLHQLSEALQERRLFRWMMRHPVWAARLAKGLVSARSRRSSSRSTVPASEALLENVSFIQQSVAETQSINAVQHHIERDLLRAPYLASEPYVRLRLRGAGQWLRYMNRGEVRMPGDLAGGVQADILLLMHRSGVMQLTIALKLPDQITVDTYRKMAFGSSEIVVASRVSEPVLSAAYGRRAGHLLDGEWEGEQEAGVRWRFAQHETLASISDLFTLYSEAVTRTIGSELPSDWLCYPAVFVDKIQCCSSEASFKNNHADELSNAISRSIEVSQVRPEALSSMVPDDCSLTKDSSLYCNMSSSFEVRWPGSSGGEFAQHLQRLVILESALIQYWQIRLLDRRVGVTDSSIRQVREIQREAIFGLREYRDSAISYGTAMDLTQKILEEWRADKLYEHVLEGIDQLQQLVVAAESERSSKRANVLAGIALIVAIFLGLPAIGDTLEIAQKVKIGGPLGVLLKPFHALASQGDKGTWVGYLIFLMSVLVCLLALTPRRARSRTRKSKKAPGISWPLGTVRIERHDGSGTGSS
ncbi:hypothetical protein [Streptomyces sp. NBC_00198]|uniref:hypothetical protein n=1 Tax=Streptomyces sp. NBC_00198 TaxID=2975677 RepID=UPI0022557A45|nr:hypothetical protein [Streptomyces sp. NBC_00198]MCX5283625.1 hypothetical protein [Streptomyces sp. NBC_00198]